ncbi:MAG: ribonuclease HII [Thaumarchaeota archaeon]|nr:ribonuclease HII [Nitrososphaerota archaeon]
MIGGVDEAGRGPIIGPLVVAGVSVKESDVEVLKSIGVRDSKLIPRPVRERLYRIIKEVASKVVVEKIEPRVIYEYVSHGKYERLNYLEAIVMAKVIDGLDADVVYVDSCGPTDRLERDIRSHLKRKGVRLVVEHHADRNYTVVGAASIVAKVERDLVIDALKERWGDFGSGYTSDPRTLEFVKRLLDSGELPEFVRKSWKTLDWMKQKSLDDY